MTRLTARQAVLLTVLLTVLAARTLPAYRRALRLRTHFSDTPYAAHFYRGLIPIVRWLQRNRVDPVYGPSNEDSEYLCQRLSELLYPISFRPFDLRTARAGDVAVLPSTRLPAAPHEALFASGPFRVIRMKQ
jgi:hypothetical protein